MASVDEFSTTENRRWSGPPLRENAGRGAAGGGTRAGCGGVRGGGRARPIPSPQPRRANSRQSARKADSRQQTASEHCNVEQAPAPAPAPAVVPR